MLHGPLTGGDQAGQRGHERGDGGDVLEAAACADMCQHRGITWLTAEAELEAERRLTAAAERRAELARQAQQLVQAPPARKRWTLFRRG